MRTGKELMELYENNDAATLRKILTNEELALLRFTSDGEGVTVTDRE